MTIGRHHRLGLRQRRPLAAGAARRLAPLAIGALALGALAFSTVRAPAADPRLEPLVNLRVDRFPFTPPESAQAWERRASEVRRQVQVAAGLWPMPDRPEPKATFHGRVEREGYTIDAVSLESFPGHYVTGSLYRPTEPASGPTAGPRPGVLSPHGHWGGGRFHSWGDDELAKQIASGAERFETGGRHPLQARCVQLARMGCVVFLYDMLGYGDSRQIWLEAIHAPSHKTVLDAPDAWGFYSPQAESRLQGPLGVQTYNSLCALDWLESLDGVDPQRLAVTGGSSGATQTLMLCAVDDRPAVAFPVVMVSTAMQGGCGCENACALRLGTSNVEFAAMMAPKPLGIASADDWTRHFAEDGYPELRRLYTLLGHPERLKHASLIQYPHNYNHASRAAMYEWFDQTLGLGAGDAVVEADYVPVTAEEIRIDDLGPTGALDERSHEVELMRVFAAQSDEALARFKPTDKEGLERYREVVGGAMSVLLDRADRALLDSAAANVQPSAAASAERAFETLNLTIHNADAGVDLPAVAALPKDAERVVVLTAAAGKAAVVTPSGDPTPVAERLLAAGVGVLGVDLYAQGDLAPEDGPLEIAPVVPAPRPIPSLTFGYNRTTVAHRASDLLAAVAAARRLTPQVERVGVIALEGGAPYAVAALTLAGESVDAALVDTEGFRFADLTSWRDPRFQPGAVKYGDLPGLLALCAPHPLVLQGEADGARLDLTQAAYRAAGANDQLVVQAGTGADEVAIARFLSMLDARVAENMLGD